MAARTTGYLSAALEVCAQEFRGAVEAAGAIEHRLEVRDVVGARLHLRDVPRTDLRVAKRIELTVGTEQPGSVGADLAPLLHDAEFDGEPEHLREAFEILRRRRPQAGTSRGGIEIGE